MRKSFLLLMVIFATLVCSCGKKVVVDAIDIVPEPVFMVQKEGSYVISKKTKICFQNLGQNNETARQITRSLKKLHIRPSFSPEPTSDCIIFLLNDTVNDLIGEEGYLLEVRADRILISANSEVGLFYGYQTLAQMLPPDASDVHYSRIQLPSCTIQDFPRFAWRGSMLDVSSHMMSVKDVKRHLDLMAAYKLNKFHWHLADDYGWRIEIAKYPQLNDVGSWRPERSGQPWDEVAPPSENESANYGGFYTREEIAEVVEYAAKLHIDVIPEIEIPSHCSAILAAYPEFACTTDTTHYQVQVGGASPSRASLCVGNDSVMQFMRDIFDEIIPLFPYEYVHIGGFGSYDGHWESCPKCGSRMRENNLDSASLLKGWFAHELEKYLELQGKKVLGWDEVMGGATTNTVVMLHGDQKFGAEAVRMGYDVVMATPSFCNFDFVQGNPSFQPAGPKGHLTLYKVYQFDPMPENLEERLQSHVLGGQMLLWTGYMDDYQQAEYMLLPRMLAFSESVWSPVEKKDWANFRHKVAVHKRMLGNLKYQYCEGSFMPIVNALDNHDGTFQVTIDYEVEGTRVYYCVGDIPTQESRILYTSPFTVPAGSVVKAVSYYKGKAMEEVYSFPIGQ